VDVKTADDSGVSRQSEDGFSWTYRD